MNLCDKHFVYILSLYHSNNPIISLLQMMKVSIQGLKSHKSHSG